MRAVRTAGEWTLRGYRRGDLDAMYRLDLECFEPVFRFSNSMMRQCAEARHARVLLALRDEQLAGFVILHVSLHEGRRFGYIVTLDVALSQRRKGLARVLMSEIEQTAHEEGLRGLALHVFVGNDAAIRFYEAMGYGRSHRVDGFYGAGIDAWIYRKRLTGEESGGAEWASFRG